ncbi:hypothetical protein DFJ58DRAFT_774004 [Suillus subalutaceus]|uniref:uncharacterized protein n=1 Tax=Suillus subalutaceus TaxID=48586 RepID=UPI001B8601CD|nr:uncharacterized protein DFJ58DRAFT_774004 [Suillus subalutaceus]KAG1863602.1 hypothetical protein DFJ58DRAFT_774004 [Suillus subalutaceus]
MKLQFIDQLDKADLPSVPKAYIYLLAVQCIVSLCEGLASFTGPSTVHVHHGSTSSSDWRACHSCTCRS